MFVFQGVWFSIACLFGTNVFMKKFGDISSSLLSLPTRNNAFGLKTINRLKIRGRDLIMSMPRHPNPKVKTNV